MSGVILNCAFTLLSFPWEPEEQYSSYKSVCITLKDSPCAKLRRQNGGALLLWFHECKAKNMHVFTSCDTSWSSLGKVATFSGWHIHIMHNHVSIVCMSYRRENRGAC